MMEMYVPKSKNLSTKQLSKAAMSNISQDTLRFSLQGK